jgi:hypothetical protein
LTRATWRPDAQWNARNHLLVIDDRSSRRWLSTTDDKERASPAGHPMPRVAAVRFRHPEPAFRDIPLDRLCNNYCVTSILARDWSGAALFNREKLLVEKEPVPYPVRCDKVFAVIDTASKRGADHDATVVTYLARNSIGTLRLFILDWDIVQIEGAILETWLPSVFERLEELSRLCGARHGSVGAFVVDKNSGTILPQQARKRDRPAHDIDSKVTAVGKDERAMSVSSYVHRELVKYADRAFHKIRSRVFAGAIKEVTERTICSIPSVMASRCLSGIARASNSSSTSD